MRSSCAFTSSGTCVALGLYGITRREDADNLMAAALTYTGADGEFHVVDLELDDVKGVFEDAARLLGANAEQVALWWRRLADGRDGRPRAAAQ
jgi:hypothetical protein